MSSRPPRNVYGAVPTNLNSSFIIIVHRLELSAANVQAALRSQLLHLQVPDGIS